MRETKDSNIKWVGAIPSTWTTELGKHFMTCLDRPVKEDDGVITCFRDGEVTLRSKRREEGFTVSFQEIGYQGIEPGDLVVHGMDGFAGAIGISDSRGKATPVLNVLDTEQDKRYMMYALRNMAYTDVFLALSTGIRVRSCDTSWKKLRSLQYALPPLDEQSKIADRIEQKSKQVDALIANQQAQIEKLKQYKQSLITEVVTKGLNPDAPMKDSGFIYYGQIPAQWKLVATKYLYRIESGATPKSENPDYFDGDIPWITPADYKTDDVFVSGGRRSLTEQGLNSCSTTLIPKGSIIFSKRAPIGSVAINSETLCTNQGCLSCIPRTNDLSKYFYYVMSVMAEQYNLLGSGTTFKEISANNFANFILPQPPIQEQQLIVSFLDEKCSKIQKLISIKTQKIDRMISYKKSLIYEYVTGKKEVV